MPVLPTYAAESGAKPWFVHTVDRVLSKLDKPSPAPTRPRIQPASSAHPRLTHWAKQSVRLVVKYQQNPLRAARTLAYTQVAMHDAWLHTLRAGGTDTAAELGAHRAASLLIEQLYPLETPGQFEAQFAAVTAALHQSPDADQMGLQVGLAVGEALIARSLRDGAGRVWPLKERPPFFPGMWQPTPPLHVVNPVEAAAPQWLPWLPPGAWRHVPPTAHRPGSAEHAAETREVLVVTRQLNEHQRQVARGWHLDAGSVTPAGIWMQLALQHLHSQSPSGEADHQTLPVLAALSVAMLDALVACWQVKLRDWSERPITAVRRALDAAFEPLLATPGFPAYVSGHASVSAAAAAVLGNFWPEQSRRLHALAEEAALSRLWGGIHFRSDNDEGLRLGRAVGQAVVARVHRV